MYKAHFPHVQSEPYLRHDCLSVLIPWIGRQRSFTGGNVISSVVLDSTVMDLLPKSSKHELWLRFVVTLVAAWAGFSCSEVFFVFVFFFPCFFFSYVSLNKIRNNFIWIVEVRNNRRHTQSFASTHWELKVKETAKRSRRKKLKDYNWFNFAWYMCCSGVLYS